jgi:hypothetical protein
MKKPNERSKAKTNTFGYLTHISVYAYGGRVEHLGSRKLNSRVAQTGQLSFKQRAVAAENRRNP